MTNWKQLSEKLDTYLQLQEVLVGKSTIHSWNKVRAVGDEMNATVQIQDEQLLQESLKLEETEALLQLANSRCNELAKQLGETQRQNEIIRDREADTMKMWAETIESLNEDEKKLEAIEKEMRFFESLEVNLEEFKAKDIVKQFRKVLGVRKEMQEKDVSC